MPVKVFISYSSADRTEALEVRRLLTSRGCTVWLDVFDIRVAGDLKRELGEGIGNADVLCLLLSPTAVASPWVAEEIARGEEHAANRGMRLIAVLLRPCRPLDSLLGRVMLDATAGISSPDVTARLVRAVLGKEVVGDMEIDIAMQEALQARQNEMEAALVLPELAKQLEDFKGKNEMYTPQDPSYVNFTLSAPSVITQGNDYEICVWAYFSEQEQKMLEYAKQFHETENLIIKSKRSVPVQLKTLIAVHLDIPDFEIKEPDDTIYWNGDIANASFTVGVPADILSGRYKGKVLLFVEGLQIAKLDFSLSIGIEETKASSVFVKQMLINSAFASYASEDRNEVLGRIQGIQKVRPDIDIFLDVLSLRSGEDWYNRLTEEIKKRDIFYLFWSEASSKSKCVSVEWQTALASKGIDFISPVPLVSPAEIPPPQELASLHFNDWILAFRTKRLYDTKMQEALQARPNEKETLVLPEPIKQPDNVRGLPIRRLKISFRQEALPSDKVLAISLTLDELFSQPMWFLFAHYREGHTWPQWMKNMRERDHHEIRSDGKRIDGRFEWFDHVRVLDPQLDGTDLRDLPVTFNLELNGGQWQPGGAIASYEGGPTVPHLKQKMEVPSLAKLIEKKASFAVALIGREEGSQEAVVLEENDLDVRIFGTAGNRTITLFRSAHSPIERAILRGAFLQNRKSPIEREAILGLYPRPQELAVEDRTRRRQAAYALLERPEKELSPEERRVVGLLHYNQAVLEVFRVFNNAPLPGPAREKLHRSALGECMAVCRILSPLAVEDPRIDDVGMTFWAASNLANYYLKSGAADRAVPYAKYSVDLVQKAALKDPEEPEYHRLCARGMACLAEMQAAIGDYVAATSSLNTSIDILRTLYQDLSIAGRLYDLQETVESALKVSEQWSAKSSRERQQWIELSNTLKQENYSNL